MIKVGMKNYNMILIAKQSKYRVYHQVKFTNEYLTGEDILPSNQQQIIEEAKFTYSPLGKTFEKQVKAIEDQGQKQEDALKNLKPKEQTKPIEGKYNNQSNTTIIFNDLFSKRKK